MRTDPTTLLETGCGHGTCMATEARSKETADTMHPVVPVKYISEMSHRVPIANLTPDRQLSRQLRSGSGAWRIWIRDRDSIPSRMLPERIVKSIVLGNYELLRWSSPTVQCILMQNEREQETDAVVLMDTPSACEDR